NGHSPDYTGAYDHTRPDFDLQPPKPVIDGEPLYEAHPIAFKADRNGHSIAADVRRPLYWDLFAGACGHTYGHHSVWQMWQPGRDPINNPLLPWSEALDDPGAGQMQHGRRLIESRPTANRIPDDSVIVTARVATSVPGAGRYRFVATRDRDGSYAMVYAPIGRGETGVGEPGGFGSFLGRLDFAVRDGRVVDRKWELIELRADRFAEDPEVKRVVDETLAPMRSRLDRVVGRTDVPLMRYNVVETSLDDVLSDALREAAGAEIGLSNGFRFSPPLAAGPIRESDLWDWYPINTKLKVGRVTGRQLRAFWERELEHVFAEDPTRLFGGWLPRPSGMTLRFVAHAPEGERVREIRVGGEPLEDDRAYNLVACEREGDAPDKLCRIPHVQDPRVLDVDAHE
ncbi:hypothetical protein HK102_012144, partial [Quaeritorhiza haematococci]